MRALYVHFVLNLVHKCTIKPISKPQFASKQVLTLHFVYIFQFKVSELLNPISV